jgi:hypothetical protein
VAFKVGKNDVTLTKNVDYTVTADKLKKNDAGKQTVNCTVALTGTAADNWKLSKSTLTGTCQITTKPVTVTISVEDGTYNAGKGVTPEVVVTDEDKNVIPAANYTLTWKNNTKLYTDDTFQTKNPPTVTIKKKGSNYEFISFKDGNTKYFTIGKATPDNMSSLKVNSVTYTGSVPDCSKVITGTVKLAGGSTVAGKWAWKEGSEPGADAKTYKDCVATFTPNDKTNYDPVDYTFDVTINPATLSTPTVNVPQFSATATVDQVADSITVTFGKTALEKGKDYTVSVEFGTTPTAGKSCKVNYTITLKNTNYTFVQNKKNTNTITGSKTVPVK